MTWPTFMARPLSSPSEAVRRRADAAWGAARGFQVRASAITPPRTDRAATRPRRAAAEVGRSDGAAESRSAASFLRSLGSGRIWMAGVDHGARARESTLLDSDPACWL